MGQLLVWTILFPLLAGIAILVMGNNAANMVRWTALIASIITFALTCMIANQFVPATGKRLIDPSMNVTFQFSAKPVSVAKPNSGSTVSIAPMRLQLGVDGIGVWMLVLTGLLTISAVLISWESINSNTGTYFFLLMLLETAMLGVFCAFDVILFYVFFEFTLIPLFLLIGRWGGKDRNYASLKFFIYTLAGSVITLLGVVALVLHVAQMDGKPVTLSLPELADRLQVLNQGVERDSPLNPVGAVNSELSKQYANLRFQQALIFLALFAGFAIKVPLFPFHTWLPLAHVEAPTAGSVLLAGVLLKLGTLGFLRFCLPMLPDACVQVGLPLIGILSCIGIVYGALCALAQTDIKKLVAYSSVSHLGFCMLGIISLNAEGLAGGVMQMINHGLSTGVLFLLVGMIYDRYHTREMKDLKGLADKLPLISAFMVLTCMSSAGLPMLNGFIGEFLCVAGMYRTNWIMTAVSLTGVILGAWYLLNMLRKVFFSSGIPVGHAAHAAHGDHGHGNDHAHGHHDDHAHANHAHHDHHAHGHHHVTDLNFREACAIVPIAVLFVVVGLYPNFMLDAIRPEVNAIAEQYKTRVKPVSMLANKDQKNNALIASNQPTIGQPVNAAADSSQPTSENN